MRDFAARIDRALSSARGHGVRFSAGAGAGDVEMQGLAGTEDEGRPTGGADHLEGTPGPRDPGVPDGSSKLCYFLDGVQSTREIGRIGAVPIIVTTVAATIVNRCDRRFSRMEPEGGPPTVARAVILPYSVGDEGVRALWEELTRAGLSGLGPDEVPRSPDLLLDSTQYADAPDASDYVGLRERAMVRVRGLRERLETALLRQWETDNRVLEDGKDWIAVDGQLRDIRESNRRAIGLIKSVARPEFTGEDIGVLLDLDAGKRTTSFVPGWQRDLAPGERRRSWYMRIWPPQRGADALGSLMRIEAPRETSADEVDEITRWIMAEKAPLAKPDSRWPAMIYPIQYVEKVLKPTVQGSERAFARLERQLAANGGN